MKKTIEIISYLALVLLVSAPCLFYAQMITLEINKHLMLAATVVWFASAGFRIGREKKTD